MTEASQYCQMVISLKRKPARKRRRKKRKKRKMETMTEKVELELHS